MLLFPPLPIADIQTIIQVVAFVVIIGSWVMNLIRGSKEVQQQAQQPRPQPAPPGQAAPGVAAAAQPRTPQEAIRLEVDEFLRRAGQGEEAPPPQPKRVQPQVTMMEDDGGFELENRPKQPVQPTKRRPKRQPETTAPPRPKTGIESGESVSDHVATHLQKGAFADRASHLGEEVSHSDERIEARLHKKFDHNIGTMAARRNARKAAEDARDAAQGKSVAEELVEILSTPKGVRQAIILREILTRPDERW